MSTTLAPVAPQGYRPALDGVRAVAILLVVVDHVWHDPPLPLGATGVTLFFALSGYLITGLLVDELHREGRVDFVRFYLRRSARLLPALVLVVVVCDLLFLAVGDMASVKASVPALAYVANYATVWQGAYLPGWGQTWSLAVEEHFYLLWPLVVVVLLRRGRLRTLLAWTLLGCAAALAWRTGLLALAGSDPRVVLALLHETFARADALLLGCAAALLVRMGALVPRWSVWPALTTLVAVTVVGPHVGWYATVGQTLVSVAAATVVLCVDRPGSRAVPPLSWPPLVYVGVISYGLYLWHYPLIYVAHGLGVGEPLWGRVLAGGVLAGLAAAASHRWVEAPVRRWARSREDRAPAAVAVSR